jgi:hypothetical protein
MSDTAEPATVAEPAAAAIDLDAAPADPDPDTQPRKSRSELVAEIEALRAEVARLRAGEEPVAPHDPLTTGGHLLWVLGHSTAEMRQQLATLLVRSVAAAGRCAEQDHDTRLEFAQRRADTLGATVQHVRAEVERLDRTSGPEGRAVAMAVTYALLPAEHQ